MMNGDPRNNMWRMLARSIVANSNSCHLEKILVMIKNNLTFEDPGLFSLYLSNEEDKMLKEETANTWLINQLIHFLLENNDERSKGNNISLQKELISACMLKQPWLFKKLVKRYIALTKLMCNAVEDSTEYDTFCIENVLLGFLEQKCIFQKFKISSFEKKFELIDCILNILTHGMYLGMDLYKDLFVECSDCMLYAFATLSVNIKRQGMAYASVISSQTVDFDWEVEKNLHLTLVGCQTLVQNMPIYVELGVISEKEARTLNQDIAHIFDILIFDIQSHYNYSRDCFADVAMSILSIISQSRLKTDRSIFQSLEEKITQFLSANIVLVDSNFTSVADRLNEYIENSISPIEYSHIFELCILNDFINTSPEFLPITKSIEKFHYFARTTFKKIAECSTTSTSGFCSQLQSISALLGIVNNTIQRYNIWHQIRHLSQKTPCQICEYYVDDTSYEFIDKSQIKFISLTLLATELYTLSSVMELVKQSGCITLDHFCTMAEIASILLPISACVQIKELQIDLIDVICKPLNHSYRLSLIWSQTLNIENVDSDFEKTLELKCLSLLLNIDIQFLSSRSLAYYKEIISKIIEKGTQANVFRTLIFNSLSNLLLNKVLPIQTIQDFIMNNMPLTAKANVYACEKLCDLFCLFDNKVYVFKTRRTFSVTYKIICIKCNADKLRERVGKDLFLNLLNETGGIFISSAKKQSVDKKKIQNILADYISQFPSLASNILSSLINHASYEFVHNEWNNLLVHNELCAPHIYPKPVTLFVKSFLKNSYSIDIPILENIAGKLLELVYNSLHIPSAQLQISVIEATFNFCLIEGIPEHVLIHLFKMMFVFSIRFESSAYYTAILCAVEMCFRHGITPKNILHWHKYNIFKFIAALCSSMYLRNGIGVNKGLNNISKMFGYVGPREFITKHYKLLLTMLLPWCVKFSNCFDLLREIAVVTQKDFPVILKCSFLTAYSHLLLREVTNVNNNCISFLVIQTSSTLYELLTSDIKRTVAEILIYYHKNPRGVMLAFRTLFYKSNQNCMHDVPHATVLEYITKRFLGVLTFFETCLIDPDFEKNLKYDSLLSLGEIIRFVGSKHITPFRFKILAMLKTAQTIDDMKTNNVCLKLWNIFIHTVDTQTLGPLLSTILVSLKQLLPFNSKQVNAMLKFLIVSNGNLLSVYIPDLYFVENMHVEEDIKIFVKKQIEKTRKNNFMELLQFYFRQIKHENIAVRVYGLCYLTDLFRQNRNNLNNLIFEQNNIDTTMGNVIETLMIGSRHIDKQLQLASAKCLAEFGAIEPSHLPPNYAPQGSFALNIHTDSFAIMALQELCRAYQFQKDTKYVDSFSLAIQELLLARGVCPKLKKKIEVWDSIPVHMRQLMEPLLTSCYTSLKINTSTPVYPIFGSSSCQTCEEWGFNWASAMIANMQDKDTQNLLNSFKPSIKRDANMLIVFLPYIILHALQSSNEHNYEKMYEELRYVFEAAINKNTSEISLHKRRIRGLKTLQFLPLTHSATLEEIEENIEIKCAKLGFKLLDFLDRWLREWHKEYVGHTADIKYTVVETFFQRFDKKFLANANYECGEYARALMYLEFFIEGNIKVLLQENLPFLARIYAELADSDSLEGAIGLKTTELSLSEQILANNVTENFLDSAACFEKLLQSGSLSTNNISDIVQYYLLLDSPQIALLISEGILNKLGDHCMDTFLKEIQAEPLWRLSSFDDLEKLLQSSDYNHSSNWGIQCGQALLSFRNCIKSDFSEQIERILTNILKVLKTGGIERNSYCKSYPQVMKLHLICEIEKAKHLLDNLCNTNTEQKCYNIFSDFLKDWKLRLAILQPTPKTLEPVLCLRRILLMEVVKILNHKQKSGKNSICNTINYEIGKMWIQSSELARNFGMYQRAQLYIINAEQYKIKNLPLEKAKLFWKKGDQTNCFKLIDQKLEEITAYAKSLSSIDNLSKDMRTFYADIKYFQATCNAESMNVRMDLNIQHFKDSIRANQKSEKCLVSFAQYMEKIYLSSSEEQQNSQGMETLLEIIILYGRSMTFGCEFIYQSMPRMLSIWFDITTKPKTDNYYRKIIMKMNENIDKFARTLPLFIFFTAFSQLVSRICHPSVDVYQVLKGIIVRLVQKFPQQSLWMLLSIFKSSYVGRVKRCMEMFSDKALSELEMQKLISDFNSLAEKLIELTNKEIPLAQKNPTVSSLVRALPKLFLNQNFSQIIMPFEQYMAPILPPINERSNSASTFDAFPRNAIYIKGITEKITILMSLQRPRKVSLMGNDGKNYTVMMKPKDDLRKDFRLMEFNAVVKQYLHQNPEARHRRLYIKTYAVVPLNEECGLIEWVHNLHAFRQILITFYKRRNLSMSSKELRLHACAINDPVEKKREVFRKYLLPKHPPVFSEWFRQCFTTPHNWYQARNSYIRTTAVMSIVGYVLGLGDRHGENILFDGTNGDTVHVDFNCLFNKGESFDYPEKVPFRLTHNMVRAMGPLEIEGSYRKCCELTMEVLQTQISTLMSILQPFVYDPLVSWSKVYKTDGCQERTDSQAMANVRHIEERLKGYVKINGNNSNMPLSTEGQVSFVICEATDIDNLAAMYIGWAPYM